MAAISGMEAAAPFYREAAGRFLLLVARHRSLEVARVGKAIGADRPPRGQSEPRAIVLAHIAARGTVLQPHLELHSAGDYRDVAWYDVETAELGRDVERSGLRHDQQFAIGIHEILIFHGLRHMEDM